MALNVLRTSCSSVGTTIRDERALISTSRSFLECASCSRIVFSAKSKRIMLWSWSRDGITGSGGVGGGGGGGGGRGSRWVECAVGGWFGFAGQSELF